MARGRQTRESVLRRADTGPAQTPRIKRSRRGLKSRPTLEAGRPAARLPKAICRQTSFDGERRCTLWVLLRWFKVREHERGLLFEDREFKGVLRPGRHFIW